MLQQVLCLLLFSLTLLIIIAITIVACETDGKGAHAHVSNDIEVPQDHISSCCLDEGFTSHLFRQIKALFCCIRVNRNLSPNSDRAKHNDVETRKDIVEEKAGAQRISSTLVAIEEEDGIVPQNDQDIPHLKRACRNV